MKKPHLKFYTVAIISFGCILMMGRPSVSYEVLDQKVGKDTITQVVGSQVLLFDIPMARQIDTILLVKKPDLDRIQY